MKLSTQAMIGMCCSSANAYVHGLLCAYFTAQKMPSYSQWAEVVSICSTGVSALLLFCVLGLKADSK